MSSIPVDYEYFIRVNLAIDICLTDALFGILHNEYSDPSYPGLPKDKKQLYQILANFKRRMEKQLKRFVHQDQWNILCPSSGETDSEELDVTLILVVVEYESHIQPPTHPKRWRADPNAIVNPVNEADFCVMAKHLRNEVKHGRISNIITISQFNGYWTRIENLLIGLHYSKMDIFHHLKTCPLDKYNQQIVSTWQQKFDLIAKHFNDLESSKVEVNKTNISKANSGIYTNSKKVDDLHKEVDIVKQLLKNQLEKMACVISK